MYKGCRSGPPAAKRSLSAVTSSTQSLLVRSVAFKHRVGPGEPRQHQDLQVDSAKEEASCFRACFGESTRQRFNPQLTALTYTWVLIDKALWSELRRPTDCNGTPEEVARSFTEDASICMRQLFCAALP
jgi:hypothetical protein